MDFENIEAVYEDMAVNDEEALEKYLDASVLSTEDISRLVHERKVFPCFFGSALKMSGVEEMIQNIENIPYRLSMITQVRCLQEYIKYQEMNREQDLHG